MAEQALTQNNINPREGEEPMPAMSHTLSWITHKARHAGRACIHHLSGTAAPIIVACVCLAMAYKNRRTRPPPAASRAPVIVHRPVLHRSVSMAALHGGRVALERILDSQEARVDTTTLEDAARHLHDLLAQDPLNFKSLQKAAAKLEMSGKESVAVEMLEKAWEKADKGGQPHEAHELQMLLVEMLIYKGDYKKALDCKCLYDKEISDARGGLFKSIIYTIMGNEDRAKECYDEFQEIRSLFSWSGSFKEGSPLNEVVHEFTKFQKIVLNLKKEIEEAHKTKAGGDEKRLV